MEHLSHDKSWRGTLWIYIVTATKPVFFVGPLPKLKSRPWVLNALHILTPLILEYFVKTFADFPYLLLSLHSLLPLIFHGWFFHKSSPIPESHPKGDHFPAPQTGTGCGLQSSSGIAGFESSRQGVFFRRVAFGWNRMMESSWVKFKIGVHHKNLVTWENQP